MRSRASVGPRLSLLLLLTAGIWAALPSGFAQAAAWVAPLPEPLTVTRPFDPPDHPYGPGHRGVDLGGHPGQDVRAAGAGTVVYAGQLAGRGVISIQHADGLRTTYEPVAAAVAAGFVVSIGQVIGTLDAGHAGCPASACLHWGLRRGEVYLNPLSLLRVGPVRLLPRYDAGAGLAIGPDLGVTTAPIVLGLLGLLPLARGPRLAPRLRLVSRTRTPTPATHRPREPVHNRRSGHGAPVSRALPVMHWVRWAWNASNARGAAAVRRGDGPGGRPP